MATAPMAAARMRNTHRQYSLSLSPFQTSGMNDRCLGRRCMNQARPDVQRGLGSASAEKRAPRCRDALSRNQAMRLAAAQVAAVVAAVDLAADRAAGDGAEDGAERARTAIVDRIADQRADAGADDEAGRAVVAAAIIAAVAAAIDAVVIAQPALAIIAAVAVIIVGIISAARPGAGYNRSGCRSASRGCGPGRARARIRAAPGDIRGGCRRCAARGCIRAARGARCGPGLRPAWRWPAAWRSPPSTAAKISLRMSKILRWWDAGRTKRAAERLRERNITCRVHPGFRFRRRPR